MGNAQEDEPATGPQPGYLIVGIVADTKYSRLRRDIMPTMFLPLVGNSAHFELRASGDPTALVKQVRAIVSQADNNLPLFEVRTQTQQIEQALYQERLMSRLSSFFAFLALILACIGLYGLLSYEVARRTRELGIRMALGAQKRELMRLVVRRGILLALWARVIGIGAAMAVTRLMVRVLYSVRPYDPATFAGVCSCWCWWLWPRVRSPRGERCASTPWSRCARNSPTRQLAPSEQAEFAVLSSELKPRRICSTFHALP